MSHALPSDAKFEGIERQSLQRVVFESGQEAAPLAKAKRLDTTLLAWFTLNRQDEEARQYLYSEIPEHYAFHDCGKKISKI